jgi:HNH endonuclease
MRRRTRIGARRRILARGPRATGRRAASVEEWAAIRQLVLARARWVCQACGLRRRLGVHHVVKRAQGGSDFDLNQLVAMCRNCHDQTDAPYGRGRLVITPLGLGEFLFEMVQRPGNWTRPASIGAGLIERSHETGSARATVEATSSLPMWANQPGQVRRLPWIEQGCPPM